MVLVSVMSFIPLPLSSCLYLQCPSAVLVQKTELYTVDINAVLVVSQAVCEWMQIWGAECDEDAEGQFDWANDCRTSNNTHLLVIDSLLTATSRLRLDHRCCDIDRCNTQLCCGLSKAAVSYGFITWSWNRWSCVESVGTFSLHEFSGCLVQEPDCVSKHHRERQCIPSVVNSNCKNRPPYKTASRLLETLKFD